MKKIAVVFVSLFLLFGCGHPYCHPDRPLSQVNRNYRECDYQAELSTGSMKTGADRGLNRGMIIRKCMEMKGYGTHLPFSDKCNKYDNY